MIGLEDALLKRWKPKGAFKKREDLKGNEG
jgi:hypothetical protein